MRGPFRGGLELMAWAAIGERCAVTVISRTPDDAELLLSQIPKIVGELDGAVPTEEFHVFDLQQKQVDGRIAIVAHRLSLTVTSREDAFARCDQLVDEVLRSYSRTDTHETVHGTVVIRREPAEGGQKLEIWFGDSPLSHHGFLPDGEELPSPELLYEQQREHAVVHAVRYLHEIGSRLDREQFLLAFRAFYYHRHFARFDDPETAKALLSQGIDPALTVRAGGTLGVRLTDAGETELAEWVARSTAELADEHGFTNYAREAWRLAATCNETIGNADATQECYARVLASLDDAPDRRPELAAYMSAGISAVMFLAAVDLDMYRLHWDPSPALIAALDQAERHLRIAHAGYLALQDEEIDWSRSGIELDLIRIQDLRGDRDGALSALDALVGASYWVDDARLHATALQYRVAILAKRVQDDVGARQGYVELLLDEDRTHHFEPPSFPATRGAVCLVFLGDALAELGRLDEATDAYLRALAVQLRLSSLLLRPPTPGGRIGGWLTIDILARILRTIRQSQSVHDHPFHIGDSMLLADHLKGRHLRRDIAFQLIDDHDSSRRLGEQLAGLRRELVSHQIDQRILMADYESLIEDVPDNRNHGRHLVKPEQPMAREELSSLLDLLPDETRLMSLYAALDQSYIHVVDKATRKVQLLAIPIPLSMLWRAAAYLQAAFSGRGLYAAIDPADPGRHDEKLLAPLREVERALAHAAPLLDGAELVIVAPHRLWHQLPVHGLLLPTIWSHGHHPAITYTPSFELLAQLLRRSQHRTDTTMAVALATAPATSSTRERMLEAHAQLEATLRGTGHELLARVDPPVEEIISPATQVGVQHVLAHGLLRSGGDAFASGLLMEGTIQRPAKTLTAADVLLHSRSPTHVTVQACSLGMSSVASTGDELWGFTRALLTSGANSVLAPLWSIDLTSSTRLLERFYTHWLVNGVPKWRALADAQREIAHTSEDTAHQHLYHWGAFQMTGI